MISDYLRKLIFTRQFYMTPEKIEIMNIKQAMFPLEVLKILNQLEGRNLYHIFKQSFKECTEKYSKELSAKPEDFAKWLPDMFGLLGLGTLSIIQAENFKASVKINFPEFKKTYTQDDKICHIITAGILAGIFSFIFSKDVNCNETKCMINNADSCSFDIN